MSLEDPLQTPHSSLEGPKARRTTEEAVVAIHELLSRIHVVCVRLEEITTNRPIIPLFIAIKLPKQHGITASVPNECFPV